MNRELVKGMIVMDFGGDFYTIFSHKGRSSKNHNIEVILNGVNYYSPFLGLVEKNKFKELNNVLNDGGVVLDKNIVEKVEKYLL